VYTVITKCSECGVELRRREVSEEKYMVLADAINSANDRFGDEAGSVSSATIVQYKGMCDNCREDCFDDEDF
jgi:hypothetical protein